MVKFNFHGDALDVVPGEGEAHLVIRRACEAMGVSYQGQIDKLKADPSIGVTMIVTPSPGGPQSVACIELRSLPLWLATIHPSKVNPAIREKLIRYRREAAEVLADHFLGKRSGAPASLSESQVEAIARRAAREEIAAVRAGEGVPVAPAATATKRLPAWAPTLTDEFVSAFLDAWEEVVVVVNGGRSGVSAGQAIKALSAGKLPKLAALIERAPAMVGRAVTPQSLGYQIRGLRDRVVDGRGLHGWKNNGSSLWTVMRSPPALPN